MSSKERGSARDEAVAVAGGGKVRQLEARGLRIVWEDHQQLARELLHLVESVDFFDDRAAGERLAAIRERAYAAGIPPADEDACSCPSCASLKAERDSVDAPELR